MSYARRVAMHNVRGHRIWFAHMLRGVACALVVVSHMGLFLYQQTEIARLGHFPPGPDHRVVLEGVLANRHMSPAAVGVATFFVISGFVIPYSLKHGGLRAFAIRRIFRLYPTLIAALGVTVAALSVQTLFDGATPDLSIARLASNVSLLASYFGHPWIEPVLWTLAVEEIFYLLAAVLARLGFLSSRLVILGAAGLCAAAASLIPSSPERPALYWLAFNLTFVTFILVGVALHHVYERTWSPRDGVWSAIAIGSLYVAALFHGPNNPQARMYGLSSMVALAMFVVCWWQEARLPRLKVADGLSKISYPLYLVHSVNGYVALHAVYVRTHNYYVAVAFALPLAVAGATLIHVFVENPSIALGRRLASGDGRTVGASESSPHLA